MAANILSVLLSPFTQDNITGFNILCSVKCQVLVVGDLKFYAQLLGRENMSSSWCMWCTAHPSDWKYHPIPTADRWTIDKIKQHKDQGQRLCRRGKIKAPSDNHGDNLPDRIFFCVGDGLFQAADSRRS